MEQKRWQAVSDGGMVVAPHEKAAQVGKEVLRNGGNALEAMVAMAAAITVVYPHMNSIGGDNFWLFYDKKKGIVKGINGSGRSGVLACADWYRERGHEVIPPRGYGAANTVPGAVSGWEAAYRYSHDEMEGQLSWESLLEPAILLAGEGFPVSSSQAYWTKVNIGIGMYRQLQQYEGFASLFLKQGRPYEEGEWFVQRALAESLTYLKDHGASGLYKGRLGKKIVEELKANDGVLREEDFLSHEAKWEEPICVPYGEGLAWNLPPNTQGLASLELLHILNEWDMKQIKEGSTAYYQLMIEATKEAFIDRDLHLTDPDFHDIPLATLLSKEHAQEHAERIRKRCGWEDGKLLDPKGDTVWLGAVDEKGNAVSMIQSIYYDFGSAIVIDGTGIILQNRGSFFSLDPTAVNRLEPKKRTFHTLNPPMITKENQPWLVYGTMGGEGQPQTQAALVTRILDYGMTPAEAVAAPRWLYGRSWGEAVNSVRLESRVAPEVTERLKEKGYPIEMVAPYTDVMGHAGAILIDPKTNKRYGGADPRSDGAVYGVEKK